MTLRRFRRLITPLCFVIVGGAIIGCGAAPPLYVIDVQKLAGVEPDTADQLLKAMVPSELKHENRWQEGQGDVENIIGKLFMRVYEVNNGQINKWQWKPMIELYFDADYEERVNGVNVAFIEYVSPIDALRRLGYSPKARIKHRYSSDAWYFITREYLHQVYLIDTGQSTSIHIHLDALTH